MIDRDNLTPAEKLLDELADDLTEYARRVKRLPAYREGEEWEHARLIYEMYSRAQFIDSCLQTRTYKTAQDLDREAAQCFDKFYRGLNGQTEQDEGTEQTT